jgi:hypothetical protein
MYYRTIIQYTSTTDPLRTPPTRQGQRDIILSGANLIGLRLISNSGVTIIEPNATIDTIDATGGTVEIGDGVHIRYFSHTSGARQHMVI